jgi:hypothetical protein
MALDWGNTKAGWGDFTGLDEAIGESLADKQAFGQSRTRNEEVMLRSWEERSEATLLSRSAMRSAMEMF